MKSVDSRFFYNHSRAASRQLHITFLPPALPQVLDLARLTRIRHRAHTGIVVTEDVPRLSNIPDLSIYDVMRIL